MLTRYQDPLPVTSPSTWLDRFFNSWDDDFFNGRGATLPAVNIRETDTAYNVEVAAPGLDKKDFKVHVDRRCLVIEGKHESKTGTTDGQGNGWRRQEFNYSEFQRSFALPDDVEEDKITSVYENGLLRVSIPRNEKSRAKPMKQIPVK